ncbi:flagellar biosynthesis anti-sigma factor FlgM [Fulvimonas sp. R45]|uniref:flagellar biosynthesis anti-sigma factor FlgM n=1 Tax=Fulvimonas sp. R45 TaxID=3045937 RepID=UPI00265FCF19|nr:flagellar biosynthesis anti-sigma factor FlgM [Fulvimonas sp. R45]MDO1528331.1 flagellar biosynthesis anti-sigma factor FlgM [Fulvimonas sp. R45]
MNTTITPNGMPSLPQAKNGPGATAPQNAPAASDAAVPAPAGDSVKLTESARSLHALAQAGKGDGIDAQRVEKLRQALADGSYTVDAGRIADRLASLERQLAGKP